MKDLTSKDIFSRKTYNATKISMYLKGRWRFVGLANPVREDLTESYYLMPYKFGTVKANVKKPTILYQRGAAGDYAVRSSMGIITVLSAENYRTLFPPTDVSPPTHTISSDSLRDPKYLANIVQESPDRSSNNIQVGVNNSFPRQPLPSYEVVTGQSHAGSQVIYNYELSAIPFMKPGSPNY